MEDGARAGIHLLSRERAEELRKAMEGKPVKEQNKIKQKIKNIIEDAKRKAGGENPSRKGKG